MALPKSKLRTAGVAVFTRNHRPYVEHASELSRLVTFRAAKSWSSAKRALDELGPPLRLYLACNGGGPWVEYVADLVDVHVAPDGSDDYTRQLLELSLPETKEEGLWEEYSTAVQTLYVLRGCQRLESPLSITSLIKLSDGETIAENYRYSYCLVHPEPEDIQPVSDYPDEVPSGRYAEGAVATVRVNRFERSGAARQACLEHHGFACAVCEVLLEDVYGNISARLIHVHHLVPLAQIRAGHRVDPLEDMRPVCPNCHAVLHRSEPPHTIEKIRARLGRTR